MATHEGGRRHAYTSVWWHSGSWEARETPSTFIGSELGLHAPAIRLRLLDVQVEGDAAPRLYALNELSPAEWCTSR